MIIDKSKMKQNDNGQVIIRQKLETRNYELWITNYEEKEEEDIRIEA